MELIIPISAVMSKPLHPFNAPKRGVHGGCEPSSCCPRLPVQSRCFSV